MSDIARAIEAFRGALDQHHRDMGLEDEESSPATDLWHLLVSALEWCDANGVDFDETLDEVRQNSKEFGK